MENLVIIVIIILLTGAAIVPAVRHFKGQGGCCGGGSYRPKRKKLDRVMKQKIFQISGMHCENCSSRVMEALNDIPGVSAIVKRKKGIAVVSYEYEVADTIIYEKIERLGYGITKTE